MTLRQWEQPSEGYDPDLQLVGSDNHGASGYFGIRIPPINPNIFYLLNAPIERNLFVLSTARFGPGRRARLVGFRQYISIGQYSSTSGAPSSSGYPFELPVSSAAWRFVDGNVLWGIRRIAPVGPARPLDGNTVNQFIGFANGVTDTLALNYAQTSAMIVGGGGAFQNQNYPQLIPGTPLNAEVGAFWDLRGGWGSPSDCSIPFEGPCDIAMFASIRQTNPSGLGRLVLPTTATTTGLAPEDAFLSNFTGAIYWRVAGSLLFQEDDDQEITTKPETERLPLRATLPASARDLAYGNRG